MKQIQNQKQAVENRVVRQSQGHMGTGVSGPKGEGLNSGIGGTTGTGHIE